MILMFVFEWKKTEEPKKSDIRNSEDQDGMITKY